MRCFLSASPFDEDPRFPLSLFKGFALRTGILDLGCTAKGRFLSPLISRLSEDAIPFSLRFLAPNLNHNFL